MRHTLTIDGHRVGYLEAAGERSAGTLVLLHAFPLSAEMWVPQIAARPAGWRVIAPDLPGFGVTPAFVDDEAPGRTDPAIDEYAFLVLRLLDHLGVGLAVVGGLSMGGYVAFGLVRRAPARVAGLILADTKAEADSPEARAGRDRMLATLDQDGLRGVADAMIPRLLGQTTARTRPEVAARVRSIIEGGNPAGVRGAIRRLKSRPDSTGLLPLIKCKTLVIAGEEDQMTPVEDVRRLSVGIAGAKLVVVGGAGHLSSLEQPAAFAAAVEEFLRSSPTTAQTATADTDSGGR